MNNIKLAEIAAILNCSPAAISKIRRGAYDRPTSDLPQRLAALDALIERVRGEVGIDALCYECPRQDCTGCRVAEITERR